MNSTKKIIDVAVVGGGPAALTACIYLSRAGLNTVMFEGILNGKMVPGGVLMTTTYVENYPGFKRIDGSELIDKMKEQALEFGTTILSKLVTTITRDNSSNIFKLSVGEGGDKEKEYLFKSVIVATGASPKYLGLPSEKIYENRGVSACATCDGSLPRFRGTPIVVVGGGDTAMEESLFLSRFASKVFLVHRRDSFRASNIMVERVKKDPKIEIVLDSVIEEIIGNDIDGVTYVKIKNLINGGTEDLKCSGVFVAIGHHPNSEIVKHLVETDENGYIVTYGKSSETKTPRLFACGDVQDKIYRQAMTAAGSGCVAALDAIRSLEHED